MLHFLTALYMYNIETTIVTQTLNLRLTNFPLSTTIKLVIYYLPTRLEALSRTRAHALKPSSAQDFIVLI